MNTIAILGAGMAGLGAAHRLLEQGFPSVVYEKMPYPGGHTASHVCDGGFVFDEGPHVSFTKDARIQNLLAESVRGEYETVAYNVNNYWQGHWIKHPAHCNLYGLPPDLVVEILKDFIRSQDNHKESAANYEEWLIASYGEKFARTFPMEYTEKYHTTPACNMSTDWLGPRMYRPSLDEVLFGSVSPVTPNVHYVTEFRYPRRGGFVSFLNRFVNQSAIKLGHELVLLDPERRELRFANGETVRYDGVVSSLPLPELIPLIEGVPEDVKEAAERLACSSCVVVNLGVAREDISQGHITYFYDRDILFTRLSFPHMMSRNNVPGGAGSIQAEIYYSKKYMPLDRAPGTCVEQVITDLRNCGLLRDDDRVLSSSFKVIPYANVIFDLDRAAALSTVYGYLDDIGIAYCGRYGLWAYIWTDEAFISGENAAQKTLDGINKHAGRRRVAL